MRSVYVSVSGGGLRPPAGGASVVAGRWGQRPLRETRTLDRRGRCPQRPASTTAPPKRADEDIDPYPFCPFGTFPPDRGNRPLRQILQVSCRGGYQPPAVDPAVIVRADHIHPYTQPPSVRQKAAPRDCLQSRRAAKQGMLNAHTNHRRAAAGGERSTTTSLHPRRPNFHPASPPDGSPGSGAAAPVIFGYFPSLESSPPAGGTPLAPARRRNNPQNTKQHPALRKVLFLH